MIKMEVRGRLRKEDERERRGLRLAAASYREDVEKSLMILRQVTFYLDDLVFDPRFVKDAKHKAWEVALEVFISELRNMVHYSIKPSREEVRTVDKRLRLLSQMRIAETEMEQIQVRWDLEDGLTHLLEDANRKFRRMGL